MEKEHKPLVSIIVITYNSARYVLETLESAKEQTYQNIELIVSDDGSKDNTVEICKEWIAKNKERFVRTELIAHPVNTGIPANCNRGVKAAQGEWVKLIAGDDALMPDCITNNINFINTSNDIGILFSYSYRYKNNFCQENFITKFPASMPKDFFNETISAQEQFKLLLIGNRINAPTSFIRKRIIQLVGGFDEKYKLIEDYPMWLRFTKSGHKLYFFEVVSVKHRFHVGATDSYLNNKLHKDSYYYKEAIRSEYVYPNLCYPDKINVKLNYLIRVALKKAGLNRKNIFTEKLDLILTKYLNPLWYYLFIKRKIRKIKP